MAAHPGPLTLLAVYGALLVLLAVTVFAAHQDLGVLGPVVALGIAAAKTLLVLLWFMNLRAESRLTWLTAATGFLFLALLIGLTMGDFITRVA